MSAGPHFTASSQFDFSIGKLSDVELIPIQAGLSAMPDRKRLTPGSSAQPIQWPGCALDLGPVHTAEAAAP